MIRMISYIKQRLSLRLGLVITLIIAVAFTLLFGFLFYRCKRFVQRVAIEHATQLLDNTAERMNGIIDETELVTNYMAATVPHNLEPDSLLAFTRRTVTENTFLTGFAISMEPNYFPEMGRYYSAYSLRQDDTITTVREGPFEYFDAIWYKTPRKLGKACWVDAFDDYNEGTLSARDILTSYCCPMRDAEGQYVGSITASLTLKWLSEVVTAIPAYPNSSAIMIDSDGTYIAHPDTAKLYTQTIFSDAAPEARKDIDAMGKAMLAGHSGMVETIVDGHDSYIFYRPVERTGWSIAIVCPESDVFARYNRLFFTAWIIICLGLLLLLLFCYQTIRRAVQPLSQLDRQARQIANGQFDEPLTKSTRHDSVGRLINSFIRMQSSLANSVASIRRVNTELQQKNDELTHAYQLKLETNRQKAAFIQDMYHQIRTPLNIINGFTQVLSANFTEISEEEISDITTRMKSSSKAISHITRLLIAAATDDGQVREYTSFGCNAICKEAVDAILLQAPKTINITISSDVSDNLIIHSDHRALLSILIELLDNAIKFAPQGTIEIGCSQNDERSVNFNVSDTGPGISPTDKERIFTEFTKLDTFTEGIGLGLPLSQRTARLLGGDLTLDESFSPGTRFIITLPL